MARHQGQQASPPAAPEPEQAEDNSKLHPLLRGQQPADALLAAAMRRKEQKEFQIEELEEWKTCVNVLAATPNGKMFLRSMIQFSGVNDAPELSNPQRMVTNTIKAAFYLRWVRPFINPDLRKEIEP